VGVTLAVVIEVVSVPLRTSAIAVYMFIISNVGGNMPLLVPVLQSAFENLGYDSTDSLRGNMVNCCAKWSTFLKLVYLS